HFKCLTTLEGDRSMLTTITFDCLTRVTGGAGGDKPPASWDDIRKAAAPHCPKTVDANPNAPTNRQQAQALRNAWIAGMGRFKASIGGGRRKIQAGIDAVFPK